MNTPTIIVYSNPENPLDRETMEQLKSSFGEYEHWDGVKTIREQGAFVLTANPRVISGEKDTALIQLLIEGVNRHKLGAKISSASEACYKAVSAMEGLSVMAPIFEKLQLGIPKTREESEAIGDHLVNVIKKSETNAAAIQAIKRANNSDSENAGRWNNEGRTAVAVLKHIGNLLAIGPDAEGDEIIRVINDLHEDAISKNKRKLANKVEKYKDYFDEIAASLGTRLENFGSVKQFVLHAISMIDSRALSLDTSRKDRQQFNKNLLDAFTQVAHLVGFSGATDDAIFENIVEKIRELSLSKNDKLHNNFLGNLCKTLGLPDDSHELDVALAVRRLMDSDKPIDETKQRASRPLLVLKSMANLLNLDPNCTFLQILNEVAQQKDFRDQKERAQRFLGLEVDAGSDNLAKEIMRLSHVEKQNSLNLKNDLDEIRHALIQKINLIKQDLKDADNYNITLKKELSAEKESKRIVENCLLNLCDFIDFEKDPTIPLSEKLTNLVNLSKKIKGEENENSINFETIKNTEFEIKSPEDFEKAVTLLSEKASEIVKSFGVQESLIGQQFGRSLRPTAPKALVLDYANEKTVYGEMSKRDSAAIERLVKLSEQKERDALLNNIVDEYEEMISNPEDDQPLSDEQKQKIVSDSVANSSFIDPMSYEPLLTLGDVMLDIFGETKTDEPIGWLTSIFITENGIKVNIELNKEVKHLVNKKYAHTVNFGVNSYSVDIEIPIENIDESTFEVIKSYYEINLKSYRQAENHKQTGEIPAAAIEI